MHSIHPALNAFRLASHIAFIWIHSVDAWNALVVMLLIRLDQNVLY